MYLCQIMARSFSTNQEGAVVAISETSKAEVVLYRANNGPSGRYTASGSTA